MADPFKILSAGDAVRAGDGPFNTQWHNAVSDATRKSMREAVPSTAPVRPIEVPRDSEIWIANVSETNVDQFTAIGLGRLAIPPDDAGDFRERLCFLSAPLAAGQPFGIVQDPIGPGELYVCKTASGPGGQPPRSGWIRVKGDSAAWSSATTYAIGQQVTYGGETWVAKAASTNQAPASGSYWQIAGAHRGIWDRDETYLPSDVVLLPQLGRVHIAGVSRAYLNVRNTEHAYAGIEAGELVSQRAPGPIAILWRGGIGSNWAVVRFCCDDTLTTPDVTGTGALDLGALAPAATCTYIYTPGGAPELGAVAVAGTGTYTPPVFTGSGSLTLGAAESDGVSLAYDVPPSGRLNLAALVADGEGEVTTPPRGRSRLRLGALEAAGVGAVTFPAFTGSGALDLGAVFVEHAHAHINRVVSINGSTVEKQVLSVGTSGTDFAIDDSTPGTHVLNLPDASASAWALDTTPGGSQDVSGADSRGAVNVGDQIFYGNKGCTEDHYADKYVGESLTSSRNWTAGFDQSNPWSPGHAAVTVLNSKSGSVWAAAAGLSAIGSVDVDGTTSCVDVTFMVNVAGDEAEYVYDAGFTGTIVGLSSPTSSAKTWSPRYKYLSGFTALNNPTYENGFTGSALGKTWIGGHMVGASAPTVTQAEGGTGIDTSGVTDGQIIIGKSSDHSWNLATLTAGSGITITPGAGSITIAASGGGGGAPTTADYLVKTADGTLSAERVVTDSTPITWDWATAGQVKALIAGATTLYGSFDKLTVKSSDLSVASTTDLSTATGVYVVLASSGASAISSFGTAPAGTIRLVRSNAGNVQLVYNATSMILPGKADIYLKDGDEFWAVSEGSGNWRVAPYSRLTGRPIADSPAYSAPSGMRLSTESGVPLSIGNRTSQGTLYLNVDTADYLLIPKTDISDFDVWSPGQLSLSLTMTSGKVYDVFCWNNSGTPTLQLSSAWTDDFTRADSLSTIKGVKVNGGTIGSMGSGRGIWLGTVRATGSNVTEISDAIIGVWNKYNQCVMPLAVGDSTASWTYNSTTWRQANANTANKIQAVFGERQSNSVKVLCISSNGSGGAGYGNIGINSTTTGSAQIHNFATGSGWGAGFSSYEAIQEPGFYSYNWLEAAQSGYTLTFLGYTSGGANPTDASQAGIFGSFMG